MWTHQYDPMNKVHSGRDPVDLLYAVMDYDEKVWLQYDGPMSYNETLEATVSERRPRPSARSLHKVPQDPETLLEFRSSGSGREAEPHALERPKVVQKARRVRNLGL